jgi:tRNA A22 N-methylase
VKLPSHHFIHFAYARKIRDWLKQDGHYYVALTIQNEHSNIYELVILRKLDRIGTIQLTPSDTEHAVDFINDSSTSPDQMGNRLYPDLRTTS